jgi:hypothetical protein
MKQKYNSGKVIFGTLVPGAVISLIALTYSNFKQSSWKDEACKNYSLVAERTADAAETALMAGLIGKCAFDEGLVLRSLDKVKKGNRDLREILGNTWMNEKCSLEPNTMARLEILFEQTYNLLHETEENPMYKCEND